MEVYGWDSGDGIAIGLLNRPSVSAGQNANGAKSKACFQSSPVFFMQQFNITRLDMHLTWVEGHAFPLQSLHIGPADLTFVDRLADW